MCRSGFRKIAFSVTSVPSYALTLPFCPALLSAEEKANAPENFKTLKAIGKGLEGLEYRIQVSPLDCLGCGNCADICPAKYKALVMKPLGTRLDQAENWEYSQTVSIKDNLMTKTTIKGSQFANPILSSPAHVPAAERLRILNW